MSEPLSYRDAGVDIDERPFQHVAKKGPVGFGVLRIDDHMGAIDHLPLAFWARIAFQRSSRSLMRA